MGDFEILAQRLKLLRTKLGMTQKEFADKVGFTQATLSAYENNQKKPSLDIVKDIAEKCHVSIDWLCGLTDKERYDEEINTYADMLRLIIKLCNTDSFFGKWEVIHVDNSDILDLSRTGINFAVLRNSDETLVRFFEDWEQMYNLHTAGTIDMHLYELWLSDRLKQYENLPLVPAFSDDIPDDNLPFN